MSSKTYKERERDAILGLREVVYYFRQFRKFLANVAGSVSQGSVGEMVVEISDTQDTIKVETRSNYCPFRRLDKSSGVNPVSDGGMKGDIANYLQHIPLVQIPEPLTELGHIVAFFLGKLAISRGPNSKEGYVIARYLSEHVFGPMPSLHIDSFRMLKRDKEIEMSHEDFMDLIERFIKVGDIMVEMGEWKLTDTDQTDSKLTDVVLT